MRIIIVFGIALMIALSNPVFAENNRPNLRELQSIEQEGKKFETPEFRLLWAREAFRHGNKEGAIKEWIALAKEGNPIAKYVLQLLTPVEKQE